MGSASSKAARGAAGAAGAAKRQYPQRVPANLGASAPPPPEAQAHETRNAAVDRDAHDPEFAASLRSLGPVQPNDAFSPSSSASSTTTTTFKHPQNAQNAQKQDQQFQVPPFAGGRLGGSNSQQQPVFPSQTGDNPALTVLAARTRLAREAEEEEQQQQQAAGSMGGQRRRRFLDIMEVRQILQLRDVDGLDNAEIERRLELKEGTVDKLGPKGMVSQ